MVTVSYFYQKIGSQSEQIFGNNLISIDDIISGLRKDKVKRNQKYDELLQYSGLLNKDLHKLKIKEDKRSLLVSGILIALRNKDFFRSYKEAELKFLPDNLVNTIPVKVGLEGIMSDNARLKAFLDLQDSLKEQELAGQVDFTGNIGGVDIGATATLGGDKNLNLGYQTKGGTNLGFTTDLDDNAMFRLSKTFADGGLARPGYVRGKLVGKALGLFKRQQALEKGAGQGFAAVEQYGITGKDITRMFKELAVDPSLQGKEKTEYFKVLNQALKNPEEFPDTIKEIQMKLGIEIGTGFRNGGLAGILEV